MHQVADIDHSWRKPDEMCYRKLMDTELLKDSWEKLTERGYTLSRPAPEVVNIITPTGYSTQIRLNDCPATPAMCGDFRATRHLQVAQPPLSAGLTSNSLTESMM